jgi:hypothetical protein
MKPDPMREVARGLAFFRGLNHRDAEDAEEIRKNSYNALCASASLWLMMER